MILLLNKVVYNGDALLKLKINNIDDETHEYYTIGIRGPLDIADLIQKYNVMKISIINNIIKVSGNIPEWKWLIHLLKAEKKAETKFLADNFEAILPLNTTAIQKCTSK